MKASAHSEAGDNVRGYLRDVVLAEPGVEKSLAERLADRLRNNLDRVVELYSEHARSAKRIVRKPGGKAPFDPYCFGAVATLEREGRDALLARLDAISSIENLMALAEAQHLVIDTQLQDADAVREAIVSAAVERIAGRKAASAG